MTGSKPGRWLWWLFCLLAPVALADTILDAASGQPVARAAVLERLAGADYILLGELHDNPRHHQARAGLLDELAGRYATVVVEHLDQGHRLDAAVPLDAALDQAGFARAAWRWPLHEPLFQRARAAGRPVVGGNLSRADGRQVALRGDEALDSTLAAMLAGAPLDPAARGRLDADLLKGHCGQLDGTRLPFMRLAQRGRDAAMARVLIGEPRPAVLLAGNGHVRRDYGVPRLLAVAVPMARMVSIGFLEDGAQAPDGGYDYLWYTEPTARPDPCANMKLPPRSTASFTRAGEV